ncbi:hypothetical protein [Aquiflexum gelatinilyticum]|uniref:hypothetical protein n=1 Tax=Aquiflexum gelatinilyticum TaxID=2961943 RepID=UPI0021693620|nr:hypothetical protein [Aquiflexum gelatinilyticum]MCS4433916.1 hypothetical protein [Aquiflexum gelatinilyticum]
MKNRLDSLLDKYWEGDTSLEEEKEIKTLLQETEDYESEKRFFQGIKIFANQKPEEFALLEKRKKGFGLWLKIAAIFIIFLAVGAAIFRYQEKKAEREAFEQVMQAFNMIQTNMQKGTQSLGVMGEMKHLNTTQEIFNLNDIEK